VTKGGKQRTTGRTRNDKRARPASGTKRRVGSSSSRAKGAPAAQRVHLNRAMSKLGILTRSQATAAILAGRVSVDGRIVRDPAHAIDLDRASIHVDDEQTTPARWRVLLLNKPKGVLTTRRDPQGRRTVYDLLGEDAQALVPIGRLDLATTGLLLLTSDTALAAWIEDPRNRVPRTYLVTVRGEVTEAIAAEMIAGIVEDGERLAAASVIIRKASGRESHLTLTLTEGKNREIRRLCEALGFEVTRLKRVELGGLALGDDAPGSWRELTREDLRRAFPTAPLPLD
jgi:23S rRNA pseudouridine2605 synthase